MKRERYAWVTIVPAAWVAICTLTAGWHKIFNANPAIGFLAHKEKYAAALANGEVLAPAKNLEQMSRIVFNDTVNATMATLLIALVVTMIVFAFGAIRQALGTPEVTARETHGMTPATAAE